MKVTVRNPEFERKHIWMFEITMVALKESLSAKEKEKKALKLSIQEKNKS